MTPLNSSLYRTLDGLIPGGVQHVAHPGAQGHGYEERLPGGGRSFKISDWGEGYEVACPYCGDHRHHLRINHRYGTLDPMSSRSMTHLLKCFRGDCLKDRRNRDDFSRRVLGADNESSSEYCARVTAAGRTPLSQLMPCQAPGELVPLWEQPDNHDGAGYLLLRYFDRDTLRKFDLSYCTRSNEGFELVEGRIVIPIDFQGIRVGWQARLTYTPRGNFPPRYFTMPGLPKGQILYNFDRASQQPFIVVVEGVTDVWRLGDVAVSPFGKDITEEQARLLREASCDGLKPVIVMLDAGEIRASWNATRILHRHGVQAVSIDLPDGFDPADLSSQKLFHLIYEQAFAQGVHLPQIGVL